MAGRRSGFPEEAGDPRPDGELSRAVDAGGPARVRLHLNAGRNLFQGEQELKNALAQHALLPEAMFGRVDLHPSFAFVEVPEEEVGGLLDRMQNREVQGTVLRMERARPRGRR